MPAMHFTLRWPDASETRCYSPSLIVQERFSTHTRYALADFKPRMRESLEIASERVRAKYGFACSMALDQLAEIERIAARFDDGCEIEMLHFENA